MEVGSEFFPTLCTTDGCAEARPYRAWDDGRDSATARPREQVNPAGLFEDEIEVY